MRWGPRGEANPQDGCCALVGLVVLDPSVGCGVMELPVDCGAETAAVFFVR